MALIKSKQIASVDSTKIVESSSKKFVSQAQIDSFTGLSASKQDVLGYTAENASKKNQANGYVGLDENGKIPLGAIPALDTNSTKVVSDMAAKAALSGMKTGDRCIVMEAGDGSREGYVYDGTTWLKDSDTDWANVNIAWSALVGTPTSTPGAIDAAVTKVSGLKNGYAKTIVVSPAQNAIVVNTGIKMDGSGANFTAYPEVVVALNGFTQVEGAGKDFTLSVNSNEIVITWLNRNGINLDADDEVAITFTQLA